MGQGQVLGNTKSVRKTRIAEPEKLKKYVTKEELFMIEDLSVLVWNWDLQEEEEGEVETEMKEGEDEEGDEEEEEEGDDELK